MKPLILLLVFAGSGFAEPQAPYALPLDKDNITAIPLHNEVDTLLVFPIEVESISGKGLTSGAGSTGTVLYQQGEKNKKTILLRHLDNQSTILLTVMLKDEAFVFRLEPSLEPASVIYLSKGNEPRKKVRKVTAEEALIKKRPISEQRKLELIRLTKQSNFLKSQVPKLYSGYTEKLTSIALAKDSRLTTLSHIARFENEDALVFLGTLQNYGSRSINLAYHEAFLRAGEASPYPCSKLRAEKQVIAPGETVKFEGLLIGDGRGSPLHLDLDNSFSLHLKPTL